MVFGCFIYFTDPNGHLDIIKAVCLYNGHAFIMLIFNIIFNRKPPTFSIKYILSIFLNSLTSFYSYNHYNFFSVKRKHKPTLLRQGIYYLIIITENIALTAYFALYSNSYKIEDGIGNAHTLTKITITNMVVFITILQLASIVVCALYYANHPASVSLSRIKDKMQIFIFGSSWVFKDGQWRKEKKNEISSDIDGIGASLDKLYTV